MGRNNCDKKIARKYQLPVEILRHHLPRELHEAPDHEVQGGKLIRVSNAAGLTAALFQEQGKGRKPPLEVYLVSYLPPIEATLIRDELDKQKGRSKGTRQADGAAASSSSAAAAPPPRRFFIANTEVLEAKETAYWAIEGEILNIQKFDEEVRDNPNKDPREMNQRPRQADDIGLKASKGFQAMKEAYFCSCVRTGDLVQAKQVLKQIHPALYKSLFKSFEMEPAEEDALITGLAEDYESSLHLADKTVDGGEIASQLLGLISFADFEDRKKLIMPDTTPFADRRTVLKRLKRQRQKLKKLKLENTLIGARDPDFRKVP